MTSLHARSKRFLQAELNNESAGGISPSTIASATDSLMQWPVARNDDLFPNEWARREVAFDLLALAYKHGLRARIGDICPDLQTEPAIQVDSEQNLPVEALEEALVKAQACIEADRDRLRELNGGTLDSEDSSCTQEALDAIAAVLD